MRVVVIDPGHGGSEIVDGSAPNNATSVTNVLEKDIALDLAKRVQKVLNDSNKVKCYLTRTNDSNLGLADRAAKAADKNASIFLSIHCNGYKDPKVRGTECWIDRKYHDPKRVLLAGKSRSMPGPGKPTTGIRNLNVDRDAKFAKSIADATLKSLKHFDNGAKLRSNRYSKKHHGEAYAPPKGVKMMGLGALRDAKLGTAENDCVAALLEVEFITNVKADKLFNGSSADSVRDKFAVEVASAIERFV